MDSQVTISLKPNGEGGDKEEISPTSDSSGERPENGGMYEREIEALQRTLRSLEMEGHDRNTTDEHTTKEYPKYSTPHRETRAPIREEQDSDDDDDDGGRDFVPSRLVTLSPGRHMGLAARRRSDPGRINLGIASGLISHVPRVARRGSSDSSDDGYEGDGSERSPRARSPALGGRYCTIMPEEECYPAMLAVDSRMGAAWPSSPRRRLLQPRHSHSGLSFADESPRRRTKRSNSLPLPELSALEVGEAFGAIARGSPDGNPSAFKQQQPPNPAQILKRNRCISIDEPHLEAILEESATLQKQRVAARGSARRFSAPNTEIAPGAFGTRVFP